MKNKIIKWLLSIILIVLFIVLVFKLVFMVKESKTKKAINNFVISNVHDLNSFIRKNEGKRIEGTFKGVKVQTNPDFPKVVEFFYSEHGIAPSGVSYGIYHIPNGDIEKQFDGLLKKASDNTWEYKEKDSDNSILIEHIQDNFYYFKTTN